MCRLGQQNSSIVAAYSYGVNGHDEWGEAVSRATQVPVHQYDCINTMQPSCQPPCNFVFHSECLTGFGEDPVHDLLHNATLSGSRNYETLATHLRQNGHAELPVSR